MIYRLYKYYAPERAKDVALGLVRFTRPIEFNDIFEASPVIENFDKKIVASYLQQFLNEKHYSFETEKILEFFDHREDRTGKFALLYVVLYNLGLGLRILNGNKCIADDIMKFILSQCFGVFCLSEDPDDITMWGHYASNFSGFVVEYDINNWFFKKNEDEFRQSRRNSKAPDDYSDFDVALKVNYSNIKPRLDNIDRDIVNCLITKSDKWSAEKEWRVIRSSLFESEKAKIYAEDEKKRKFFLHPDKNGRLGWPNSCIFHMPDDAIKQIIIGSRADSSEIERIIKINKKLSRKKFRKLDIDPDDYQVKSLY